MTQTNSESELRQALRGLGKYGGPIYYVAPDRYVGACATIDQIMDLVNKHYEGNIR